MSLVNIHFQRDVQFGQQPVFTGNHPFPPGGVAAPPDNAGTLRPAINEQFFAQLQLMAEPRLAHPERAFAAP